MEALLDRRWQDLSPRGFDFVGLNQSRGKAQEICIPNMLLGDNDATG